MAVTAVLSGTLTVGETGDPDVSKAVNTTTPTIDQQSVGQITTVHGQNGVTFVTIPMGTIIDAKMASLKFHDGAGNPRLVQLSVTDTTVTYILPDLSELILNSGASSLSNKLVSLKFQTPDTPTGAYVCDFVIAGDD